MSIASPELNPAETTTTDRKVYVETLGCQMNLNDSELMLGLLAKSGFSQTYLPAEADLIIVNTCQIRGNAEDKAYAQVSNFRHYKNKNPNVKIVMTGCVAQQAKDSATERSPYIDIVVGTQNIKDLPELVNKAFEKTLTTPKKPKTTFAVDRQKSYNTYEYIDQYMDEVAPVRQSSVTAWITIIEGCDYFCTYCVVPYTRGRQISRAPESIIKEARKVAEAGYKEVTLLGQTVDAYGKDFQDRKYKLAELLRDLHEQVPEIQRWRFMTSHPLDLDDSIIDAIAELPRVMEYIHIPMQAGNNTVLERMRRGYSREQYFELIDKIRTKIPDCAITGDFIVGFPGETDEQFLDTVDAVKRAQFDMAITAVYSPRKQTPAGIWVERGDEQLLSEAEGKQRLQTLNLAIEEVGLQKNLLLVDTVQEILIEGKSNRKKFDRWRGRTRTNKLVNIDVPNSEIDYLGQIVNVKITEASGFSLQGVLV